MTLCKRCGSRLFFIGQIYCPIDGNAEAFHRMLYVYACLKTKCKDSTEAVRVFRCQLPIENSYFPKQAPNYDLLDMTDSQLKKDYYEVLDSIKKTNEVDYFEATKISSESKMLSNLYMIEIEAEAEKVTKMAIASSAKQQSKSKTDQSETKEEDDDDYDDDEDSDDSKTMSQTDKEILEKYNEDGEDEGEEITEAQAKELLKTYAKKQNDKDVLKMLEDQENDIDEDDKDDASDQNIIDEFAKEFDKKKTLTNEFEIFLKVVEKNPSQVIRYSHGGN